MFEIKGLNAFGLILVLIGLFRIINTKLLTPATFKTPTYQDKRICMNAP